MRYLYKVEGLIKLHRDFFQDEDFKEKYREKNFSQEYDLNIVADDVEAAIIHYRDEVEEVFNTRDTEDDGPFNQIVNKITVREVTKLNYVDVAF